MVALLSKASVLLCITMVFAARIKRKYSEEIFRRKAHVDAKNETDLIGRTVPEAVYNSVQRLANRECALKLFDQFSRNLERNALEEVVTSAFQTVFEDTEAGNAVEDFDGIDAAAYPHCAPGSDVVECARSLPPTMWLEQRWVLEDRLEAYANPWWCPYCKSSDPDFDAEAVTQRKDFFTEAVRITGFAATTALTHCAGVSEEPDQSFLRSCVLEQAALNFFQRPGQAVKATWYGYPNHDATIDAALDNGEYYKVSWNNGTSFDTEKRHSQMKPVGDDWDKVSNALARIWSWEDKLTLSKVTRWATTGIAAGVQETIQLQMASRNEISELSKHLIDLGFNAADADKVCRGEVATLNTENRVIARVISETTSVCQSEEDCNEGPELYCPEGSACDCQRPPTPKEGLKAFNIVLWGVSPATVALIAGTVGFMSGGTAAIVPAVSAASWFPDIVPATIAMAVFSKKLFPECACFQHACEYDSSQRMCRMVPTETARESKNTFSRLPPNGVKCIQSTSKESCQIASCEKNDAAEKMPGYGHYYFGKLGRYSDGIYNCANTEGTVSSQLGLLEALPVGLLKTSTPNTPATRASIYEQSLGLNWHDGV